MSIVIGVAMSMWAMKWWILGAAIALAVAFDLDETEEETNE